MRPFKLSILGRYKWVFASFTLLLIGSIGIASWVKHRYDRFPVQRLPDLRVFNALKQNRTINDIETIKTAFDDFYSHYHHLPLISPERESQFSITLGHELNGVKPGPNSQNPDGIVFWKVSAGEQLDGWGHRYHYWLDHDGNGIVSPGGIPLKRSFVIWSDGPNKIDEQGKGDDINSW